MKRKGYNSNKQTHKIKKNIAKKLKKSTLILFLVFITGATLYFLVKFALFSFSFVWEKASKSDSFALDEIYVSGNIVLTPEEIIALTEIELGMSLLAIDNKIIEERLLSENRIERVMITRKFPSKLKIVVVEREPMALINIDKIYEVDQNGILMELVPRTVNLPLITGFETDSVGFVTFKHQIKSNLQAIVDFISKLRMADNSIMGYVSEFRLDKNNNVTLLLDNGITRVYMGSSDFYNKSVRLSTLKRKKGDNIMKHDYIDLRFENLAFVK